MVRASDWYSGLGFESQLPKLNFFRCADYHVHNQNMHVAATKHMLSTLEEQAEHNCEGREIILHT